MIGSLPTPTSGGGVNHEDAAESCKAAVEQSLGRHRKAYASPARLHQLLISLISRLPKLTKLSRNPTPADWAILSCLFL